MTAKTNNGKCKNNGTVKRSVVFGVRGGVQEAVGEVHGDAAGGDVDGVDPFEDEGDEDGLGGWSGGGEFYGEEGSGVLEAGAAVGGGGELYVDDGADGVTGGVVGGGDVVDGAAEEVADEEGSGVEGGEFAAGDEELLAGEGFGGRDAVAAGELEDDAAGVLAGGKPVLFDAKLGRTGRWRNCVRGGENDVVVGVEEAGKVAEGISEDLAATPLRAQQAGDRKPAGGGDTVQRFGPLGEVQRERLGCEGSQSLSGGS
jgi:hypothetical protein